MEALTRSASHFTPEPPVRLLLPQLIWVPSDFTTDGKYDLGHQIGGKEGKREVILNLCRCGARAFWKSSPPQEGASVWDR